MKTLWYLPPLIPPFETSSRISPNARSTPGPPSFRRRTPRASSPPARLARKAQHTRRPQGDCGLVGERRGGQVYDCGQSRAGVCPTRPPERGAGHGHLRPEYTYVVEPGRGAEAECWYVDPHAPILRGKGRERELMGLWGLGGCR